MYTRGGCREEPVFMLTKHQRQELVEENEASGGSSVCGPEAKETWDPKGHGALGQYDHWAREVPGAS